MKKINILHALIFFAGIWISIPSNSQSELVAGASGPLCRQCPKIQFVPRGACCWEVQVFGSNNVALLHNGLKMVFSGGSPYFPVQLPPSNPNLSGWIPFAFPPPQTLILYNYSSPAQAIPWGWNRLCDICFDPILATSISVVCSFSEDLGATWICQKSPITLQVANCPLPCPPANITSSGITCVGYVSLSGGNAYRYQFNIGLNTGTGQAQIVPPVLSSLGNAYIVTMNPSSGATASPGVVVTGWVDIPSPYSPQPTGNVTITLTYELSDGTLCTVPVVLTIPPCTPECSLLAYDTTIQCISLVNGLYTYQYQLSVYTGCSPSWPNTFNVSLMNLQLSSPATGTVTITNAWQNLGGSTMVFSPTPPYFTIAHCSPSYVLVTGTITTSLANPSQVALDLSFDISDPSGAVVHQCIVTTPPFTLPPCSCLGIIDADPPVVCEPQGTTLTLSGYTGNDNCVQWYMNETDPAGVNATTPTGTINPPWQGPIGQGVVFNTTGLVCNPAGAADRYWYQAVIQDPACICYPLWSQIQPIDVYPILPQMGITGSYHVCDGDMAQLSIYNNQTGAITNFGCPVEWYELIGGIPVLLNPGNPSLTTINLGPLYSPTANCQYTVYSYIAKICGECNERQWNILAFSKPVPVNIIADDYLLCWGEATTLHLVSPNICGDLCWQMSEDGGNTFADIPRATATANWNTNRLVQTTWYRVRFANFCCPEAFSNVVKIEVQQPVVATIKSDPCIPAILCPDATLELSFDQPPASTVTWQWCQDGNPISGTTGLMTYQATTPGSYQVCVTDPVCGDVTSNTIPVIPFEAKISGPCACFGQSYDLTIITNWCKPDDYKVVLTKNGGIPVVNAVFPSVVQVIDGMMCGVVTIPNILLNQGDIFTGTVKGPCGTRPLNYTPEGCECH